MTTRDATQARAVNAAAVNLGQPIAVWGLLVLPYNLRLVHFGVQVTAPRFRRRPKMDANRKGRRLLGRPVDIGLATCSGQQKCSITVTVDRVSKTDIDQMADVT